MSTPKHRKMQVIDSHTAGEPTRVVIAGLPDCGQGDMHSRLEFLAAQADWVRTSLTLEPRGAAWMVGAVLLEPVDAKNTTGVIFFNNTGYLDMCGHGLIGVIATLAYLNRIQPGTHFIETPIGTIAAELHQDGSVSFENVASCRTQKDIRLEVPEVGTIVGDMAYGGNWFFLTQVPRVDETMIDELLDLSRRIKQALLDQNICNAAEAETLHIELFAPPSDPATANSRNFVLCPGGEYDRSPCGTGTSAKLACLAAVGKLQPGETWVQESITGGKFEAMYREAENKIFPTIRGQAFITAETTIVCQPADPLQFGFQSKSLSQRREDAKKNG